MSIILITKHGECIYNVNDKPIEENARVSITKPQQTTFKNRFNFEIKRILLENTKPHGVMGLPKQPAKNPSDYLRKRTGKPPMLPPEVIKLKRTLVTSKAKPKLPPVPPRDETLIEQCNKIKHEEKDFISGNVKKIMHKKPKIPARRTNITVTGDVRDLSAGLEPHYLHTGVFAKIPPYLDNLIKIQDRVMQREKDRFGIKQPKCNYVTREERENLLAGLKANWEELQRMYQGLPILTDTIPKKNRKSKIESELKQLEKDIVLIERHPYIYVYDDINDL